MRIFQIWAELQRIPIYHLAKSTHDLGKIDTRTQRNRHTISTWPTDETCSFKWIASTRTINFHWSYQIQIEFVVATCNSRQTLISIVSFQLQLSYQLGCTTHAFPILHLWRTFIHAEHRAWLLLRNFTTSWRLPHEPTLTLQLTGSLQSTCLRDGPTKSE